MWDEKKWGRFQNLRQQELEGTLSKAEQAELSLLTQEIETEEAAYLRPATERLRREREVIEAQNRALQALVRRKEALATRLQDVLAESQAERQAIEEELARVLGGSAPTETVVTG